MDVIPERYVEDLKKEWNAFFMPDDYNDSDHFHSLSNDFASLNIAWLAVTNYYVVVVGFYIALRFE